AARGDPAVREARGAQQRERLDGAGVDDRALVLARDTDGQQHRRGRTDAPGRGVDDGDLFAEPVARLGAPGDVRLLLLDVLEFADRAARRDTQGDDPAGVRLVHARDGDALARRAD